MNTEEAFKAIQRQAPCPHDNIDTSIGNGKTWAKCHDCMVTFPQDGVMRARDAAKRFDDAIEHLRAAAEIERLRAALLNCARKAEALKRDCSADPECQQAVRNGQYQNISTTAHIALGTIRGPEGPNVRAKRGGTYP